MKLMPLPGGGKAAHGGENYAMDLSVKMRRAPPESTFIALHPSAMP